MQYGVVKSRTKTFVAELLASGICRLPRITLGWSRAGRINALLIIIKVLQCWFVVDVSGVNGSPCQVRVIVIRRCSGRRISCKATV